MTTNPTPPQVATVIRCVMCAKEPISAHRIELLTGYSPRLVMLILTDLHSSGDVEPIAGGPRHTCWVLSGRWLCERKENDCE